MSKLRWRCLVIKNFISCAGGMAIHVQAEMVPHNIHGKEAAQLPRSNAQQCDYNKFKGRSTHDQWYNVRDLK